MKVMTVEFTPWRDGSLKDSGKGQYNIFTTVYT